MIQAQQTSSDVNTVVLIQSLIDDCNKTIAYWEALPESAERSAIITGQQNIKKNHLLRLIEVQKRAEQSGNFKEDLLKYIDSLQEFIKINEELIPDYIELWFKKILDIAETILKKL